MAQTRPQRSWRSVPRWCWWLALSSLLLQGAWQYNLSPQPTPSLRHTPAPIAPLLQAFNLGDSVVSARLLSLWLQGFDVHEGDFMRLNLQDYTRLTEWMRQVLQLDPQNQYLLLLASRVYTQTRQIEQRLHMLEFVYQAFFIDPAQRWPWLVETTMQARHQLKDHMLALRYAQALSEHVPQVPADAASVYLFLLDDMGQFEVVRQQFSAWKAEGYLNQEMISILNKRLQALHNNNVH